jgi:hypothetical protein
MANPLQAEAGFDFLGGRNKNEKGAGHPHPVLI